MLAVVISSKLLQKEEMPIECSELELAALVRCRELELLVVCWMMN